MGKLQKNQTGFTMVEVLLVVLTLVIIGGAGYFVAKHVDSKNTSLNSTATNTTTSPTKAITSTPKTATPVNPYAGWQSYTLKYDKLSFKYPATWSIKSTSSTGATDFVQFDSSDGFNFSVQDGEDQPGGDGVKIISTQPVTFVGQSDYIAYLADFPQNDPSQSIVALGSVVSDPTNQWSRPTDKNATASDGSGKYVSILFSYQTTPTKQLTAKTVLSDTEYETAKLVVESMTY